MLLRSFVPEGGVGKVKVGQQAHVYPDSNPKQAVPAEVIRVDPEVMFTSENTYFKEDRLKQVLGLKLGLRGAYGYATPGMPADGRIQIGTEPGVVTEGTVLMLAEIEEAAESPASLDDIVAEANQLAKSYGSLKALDEVSQVRAGEIFGLIGADKTTAFKTIAGVL